ncbi:uncharacterized protein LOC109805662 [Cajanus cajan]|uniref:uncharacterized protein LOC109805662 n=1 Tax=Cajanus cajan TaxID=3821 RepID=UPI00098D7FB5|nr:uncharacterized protein LOC109805662 [Cajanus cajan]
MVCTFAEVSDKPATKAFSLVMVEKERINIIELENNVGVKSDSGSTSDNLIEPPIIHATSPGANSEVKEHGYDEINVDEATKDDNIVEVKEKDDIGSPDSNDTVIVDIIGLSDDEVDNRLTAAKVQIPQNSAEGKNEQTSTFDDSGSGNERKNSSESNKRKHGNGSSESSDSDSNQSKNSSESNKRKNQSGSSRSGSSDSESNNEELINKN